MAADGHCPQERRARNAFQERQGRFRVRAVGEAHRLSRGDRRPLRHRGLDHRAALDAKAPQARETDGEADPEGRRRHPFGIHGRLRRHRRGAGGCARDDRRRIGSPESHRPGRDRFHHSPGGRRRNPGDDPPDAPNHRNRLRQSHPCDQGIRVGTDTQQDKGDINDNESMHSRSSCSKFV